MLQTCALGRHRGKSIIAFSPHSLCSCTLREGLQPLTVSKLPLSTLPRSMPSRYFSATSKSASFGHSENQSMVVQFTRAGY